MNSPLPRYTASAASSALLLFLACVPLPSESATITVTANAADSVAVNGQCSLREAITNVNKGVDYHSDCVANNAPNPYGTMDTIVLPAGTFRTTLANAPGTPSWGEDLNATGDYDIAKSVSIVGAGAALTLIDGNGAVIRDRVFDIDPALAGGVAVSFSGVTITGGNCAATGCDGGGIRKNGGATGPRGNFPNPLTLLNMTLSNNSTGGGAGGGLYNNGYSYGAVDVTTITNSTISGNTAGGGKAGGGIASSFGTVTVTGSTITGNTATYTGGGIYNYSDLSITQSVISNNTATDGGGIHNDNNSTYTFGTLVLVDSTVSGNKATQVGTGRGGGIKNGVKLSISNSTIANNSASFGGGIDSSLNESVTLTNSTLTGNTALYGGAIFSNGPSGSGNFAIANSTISANSGTGYVGGITSNRGVTLSNTIIAKQTIGIDCSGVGVASTGHNLESATACGLNGTGDKQGANPMLAPLASNGGPTQTMALLSGSPAIDAATCALAKDQRGTARPQGQGCDMGAFEGTASSSTTATSDCLFNWVERNLSQYFFPAGAASANVSTFYYRYYAGSGNYVATSSSDNHLWVLGPSFGGSAVNVGPITDFLAVTGCAP